MKVLIGAVDIGWRINRYQRFLNSNNTNGIKVESLVKYKVPSSQFNASYNYEYNFPSYSKLKRIFVSLFIFIRAIYKYKSFHFLSGETLLNRNLRTLEFRIYKLLRKHICMHFVGSDIRNPAYLSNQNCSSNIKTDIQLDWQKKLVSDSLLFADNILVSTPDLLEIIPKAKYFPISIDINEFFKLWNKYTTVDYKFFKSNKVKILHAPSNPPLKGSSIINECISELQRKGLEFEYIYGPDIKSDSHSTYTVSRYDLFQLYREADIVIDQIIIGWYGQQALEAILSNCITFCYIKQQFTKYLGENQPFKNTTRKTLTKDLEETVRNISKEKEKLAQNIEWVTNNHGIESHKKMLLNSFGIREKSTN